MNPEEMEANKDEVISMLDEEYGTESPVPEDTNAQWRVHENEPFIKPTTSQHTFRVSKKRWNEIFGHE